MSIHTEHPDLHDFGLADGCPRCHELAGSLSYLDIKALLLLHRRLADGLPPRSYNERQALDALAYLERIANRIKKAEEETS